MYINVIDSASAEKFKNNTKKGYWVILYYADWCPHCTSMKPEWNKFANKYQNNPHINVADVESNFVGNIGEEHKQNIQGFPSIVSCMKGRKVSDFTGERTSDGFDTFANSTFKQNKPSTNINKLLRNNIKRSLSKTLKKLKALKKVKPTRKGKKILTPTPMIMTGGKKAKKQSKKQSKRQMGGGPSEAEQSAFNTIVSTLTFQPITKKKIEYIPAESLDTMTNLSYFKYTSDVPRPLETVINGKKEVNNVITKGDVVICGSEGEKIVISSDKFSKLYQLDNATGVVFTEQTPKQVSQYTGSEILYFAPSWNNDEKMVLNPNDYLVKESEGKYYPIEASVFTTTYNELPGAKSSGRFGLGFLGF
jgi:thiol-disulfide isomerase/thioredoxin